MMLAEIDAWAPVSKNSLSDGLSKLLLSVVASCLLSSCALIPQLTKPAECPASAEIIPPLLEPQSCPEPQVIERIVTKIVAPEPMPQASTAGKFHLPIVGAVEWAKIQPAGLWIESRIDTGADTTSIHAENIQLVEKDGKRYVRFVLIDAVTGSAHQQELRLRRRVLIKQSGGADERRYVVRMWVTLGEIRSKIDVNLSDRTDFEYPLLIGRNFLMDNVIVDVSRHHTAMARPEISSD
ncbi:hypothetical protein U062_00779 [Gammaproteobacteria bacterium MOLA455]|nr:hypothetical protein U062_00779 [Gammaproteobacteria bacterium MOLA455]